MSHTATEGAGTAFLRVGFDEAGVPDEPVVVVDLDDTVSWQERSVDGRSAWFAGGRVTVGRATQPLSPQALEVARSLTCTVVPTGSSVDRALVEVADVDAAVAALVDRTRTAPRAGIALDGLLRVTARLGPETGVVAESFAYSMLLEGPEFAAWRAGRARRPLPPSAEPVQVRREGGVLDIRLDRPSRGNAFTSDLRAALVEALRLAEIDPTVTRVRLSGNGRSFSTGGDLDEFGSVTDPGAAHAVRLDQSAGLAVHRVADKVVAHVHGPCIGAGAEVPAFAGRVVADAATTFLLPELDLGLVPGAGGTVSVTRRIGRWRTAYLMLSGTAIDARTALAWGLVDEIA